MKKVAVVPAYNEQTTISKVVGELKKYLDAVIVVDDGSVDHTYKLAKEAGAVILRHFLNRGQGAALQTGIECALKIGADIIITFDADGQHRASDIERLIQPIISRETEVSLGSRFYKNQKSKIPLIKIIVLKLAVLFDRAHTGLKITDTHNGLRAFSANAAKKIKINQDGMAHASEILAEVSRNKLKYIEVPVAVTYSDYAKNKGQSVFNSIKIVRDLIVGKISK